MNDFARGTAKLEAMREANRPADPPTWLPWLDIAEIASRPAPEVEFAVDNWIPGKGATLIGAHGGGGKTVLAAQITLCLASGTPFLGLEVRRHRVALVLYETSRPIAHRRMKTAAHALGIDLDALARDGWLHVLLADETRDGVVLFGREPQTDDRGRAYLPPTAEATTAYHDLRAALRERGITALIVDPATDAFDGDEVNRRDVRAFISALRRMIDGPVIITMHVNRNSARTARPGDNWSGSTAWHNSCRARLELLPAVTADDEDGPAIREDDGIRILHLAKCNDGKTGREIEIRLDFAKWIFEPTVATTTGGGDVVDAIRRRTDRAWLVDLVRTADERGDPIHAAQQANRNAHARAIARDDCPARFRGTRGKKALFLEINRLIESGDLRTETRRNAGRNNVAVLVATAYAST